MSKDFQNTVLPYRTEIPMDFKATVFSRFISGYSPYEFTNWVDESMSWKTGCMIGDWSGIHKANLSGPDVLPFMQTLSGFRADPYPVGQGKHIVCTNHRGKVIGEGIMIRLSNDSFRITGGPAFVEWTDFNLKRTNKWNASSQICSDDYFVFQIQGPTSVDILEAVVGECLRDIRYMYFKEVEICGAKVIALRQGMSGNIGFELQGPSEKGAEIFNAIMAAGEAFGGVTKVGNLAKGVNHAEACFPTGTWDYTPALYDPDNEVTKAFCDSMGPMSLFMRGVFARNAGGSAEGGVMDAIFSPVELGWSYALSFDHDFPGCEILKKEKANPKRKICTLVWNSEDVLDVDASYYREGEPYKHFVMPRDYEMAPDKVMSGKEQIGISLSRAYSVYFRKMISLAVLNVDFCKEGTEVEVIWGYRGHPQKTIRATVAPAPIFNPNKKRDL